MNADQWIKLVQTLIPLLETLIWPISVYIVLRHFSPSIKKFIEHSSKFTGKISTSGIEITSEQLETTSQVSASLTAASINKEAILQFPDLPNDHNNVQDSKPALSSEKVLEIGYVVGQALNTQITRQLAKTSILWIEDNQQDNTFEKNALKTLGVQITTCSTIEEALGKAQLNNYHLLISSITQDSSTQLDFILLDKLNELRGVLYFIAYKPLNHFEDKEELIKKGGFGYTDEPLELFQLVVSAVTEIQASLRRVGSNFEKAVSRWVASTFNVTEILSTREQLIPHLLSCYDDENKMQVAIPTYYRTNSLIDRVPNIIERVQFLLKVNKYDEIAIVLVTPVESIAQRLATNIKNLTDIPAKNSIVVGYLKDEIFEPTFFFPSQPKLLNQIVQKPLDSLFNRT